MLRKILQSLTNILPSARAEVPDVDSGIETRDMYDKAIDWEASRILTIEHSERRAWNLVYATVGLLLLSWLAIVLMMPLKETVPYVVRVDNTTGVTDIVTTISDKKVTGDDVMNKYWLSQYVLAHETYDWYTLQKDYDKVGLLSSPNVGKSYAQQYEGKEALDKKYGATTRITVAIISAVPTSATTGTVRFIKTTKRVDDDGPGVSAKYIATVAFEYRGTSKIKESQRLVNPFGFQVLSYRVDPEMLGGGAQ